MEISLLLNRQLRPNLKRFMMRRQYSGEVRGPGGGKFSEREHAQEEQYFRKKEREEIAKYKEELEKAAKKQAEQTPTNNEPKK